MYKEYLAEFWYSAKALENSKVSFFVPTSGIYGEVGVNTFRNAIGAHYLAHSSEYIAPPSIDIVRSWFETIGKEEAKGGSSKATTDSKTGHSKKRKESSSAIDSNPSQPPVSTPVDTRMHKEDQQATGGPTSLGVTSEARSNSQLSSGMSASNLIKSIYSASFIVHSKSVSGYDASANSTAKVDPGLSAPSDFLPQQQSMNEGTKNTSHGHLFASTDPHVLADQTKSISEGLETVLTQSITGKGASLVSRQIKEETSCTIKLEDLAKLVSHVQLSFKDMDSPEDDLVIVVDDSDEDEDDEVRATENVETKDTSVPKYSSPNNSLPTELKDLPSKFDELIEELKGLKKQVHELEIELPGDLKEIPTKLEDFTKTVASVQAKLKTLDALPCLLLNVTKALNKFSQVLDFASSKAGDQSVPSAGQANTRPAEGEKDTNQATISQLFQRRAEKSAEKDNLNKNKLQTETTPPPIPLVITTTITQMQSPSLQPPPKRSSQPGGEHIKKDKGKKDLSSKEAEKESTDSDPDDKTHVTSYIS
ncbi:hypothetical protein Tco_1095648 [Tanacetum coccineum]